MLGRTERTALSESDAVAEMVMHEQIQRLDRARRRWRAIALALALGHLVAMVGGYLVVRTYETRLATALAGEQRAVALERRAQAIGTSYLETIKRYQAESLEKD